MHIGHINQISAINIKLRSQFNIWLILLWLGWFFFFFIIFFWLLIVAIFVFTFIFLRLRRLRIHRLISFFIFYVFFRITLLLFRIFGALVFAHGWIFGYWFLSLTLFLTLIFFNLLFHLFCFHKEYDRWHMYWSCGWFNSWLVAVNLPLPLELHISEYSKPCAKAKK